MIGAWLGLWICSAWTIAPAAARSSLAGGVSGGKAGGGSGGRAALARASSGESGDLAATGALRVAAAGRRGRRRRGRRGGGSGRFLGRGGDRFGFEVEVQRVFDRQHRLRDGIRSRIVLRHCVRLVIYSVPVATARDLFPFARRPGASRRIASGN